MYTLRQYAQPDSLEEAYRLLTAARNNVILGGCMWVRLGKRAYGTGIDLSLLGLDQITETDSTIEIGAMVSLRQVETSALLQEYFGSLFTDAVSGIVGTQFRNTATMGGSIYGRFGFSDVLTACLALPAQIKLYHAGIVSIEGFAEMPYEKDIVEAIILPKQKISAAYQHLRYQATDFPILTCAVGKQGDTYRIAIGARPQRANLSYIGTQPDAAQITAGLKFGSNMRASEEYRRAVCPVLIERACREVESCR